MKSIGAVDLSTAALLAVKLAEAVQQPPVIIGALAMAAHGYRRETSDVDIALPIVIASPEGQDLQGLAHEIGLEVRAKHSFGGLDLRHGNVRIDVLTLDRDMPLLISEAVEEAVRANRKTDLFGQQVYVVSLGHLIALKMMAERRKDLSDVTELIKVQLEAGTWWEQEGDVAAVVRRHLGYSAGSILRRLVDDARRESGY